MSRLVLNHQLMIQLWADPLFWESVPDWEHYREEAEAEVAASLSAQSSLSTGRGKLYNGWIAKLETGSVKDPASVKQITDYIHKKRKYRQEQIVLPVTRNRRTQLLLSNGVEIHATANKVDPLRGRHSEFQ